VAYYNEYKKGFWSVQFYFEDHSGAKKRKRKTGFKTKRDAKAWMEKFIEQQQMSPQDASGVNMMFPDFVNDYLSKMSSDLRDSTLATKNHIIELHITPFFKDMRVADITEVDIKNWQNEIKQKDFSDSYLRTIHAQLSAIFNYAVRFYHLGYNPCISVGGMGKTRSGCKGIWEPKDMDLFLEQVKSKPIVYYAFFLIYWTGIRVGELLALNIEDLDLDDKLLRINKSLNRVGSEDIVTPPKTEKSIRTIPLPEFVVETMREYVSLLYCRMPEDRLFSITKSHLEKEIKRGANLAGVKEIRVHDLRHSHASLLLSQGVDIATLSRRLGHEKITTTLNTYGHMLDNKAREAVDKLDALYNSGEDD
jgi:integrase